MTNLATKFHVDLDHAVWILKLKDLKYASQKNKLINNISYSMVLKDFIEVMHMDVIVKMWMDGLYFHLRVRVVWRWKLLVDDTWHFKVKTFHLSTGLIIWHPWYQLWGWEVEGKWTLHFCALGVRVLISKSCF